RVIVTGICCGQSYDKRPKTQSIPYFSHYREMIGRQFAVVAVGQYAIAYHVEGRREKDMVDPAFAPPRNVETVERAVRRIFQRSQLVGIFNRPAGIEQLIAVAVLIDVEITRDDHRRTAAQFPRLFHDQFRAFLAGFDTHVIEMGIKEEKLETGTLIPKQSPCADAGQGGIPAFVWCFRIFGKPECTLFDDFKLSGVKKYR